MIQPHEQHTETVPFRLSKRLVNELERLAEKEETSVSEIVREALAKRWGLELVIHDRATKRGTVTVELQREDAYLIGLGPLGYTCAVNHEKDPWFGIAIEGGSAARARRTIMQALGHNVTVEGN